MHNTQHLFSASTPVCEILKRIFLVQLIIFAGDIILSWLTIINSLKIRKAESYGDLELTSKQTKKKCQIIGGTTKAPHIIDCHQFDDTGKRCTLTDNSGGKYSPIIVYHESEVHTIFPHVFFPASWECLCSTEATFYWWQIPNSLSFFPLPSLKCALSSLGFTSETRLFSCQSLQTFPPWESWVLVPLPFRLSVNSTFYVQLQFRWLFQPFCGVLVSPHLQIASPPFNFPPSASPHLPVPFSLYLHGLPYTLSLVFLSFFFLPFSLNKGISWLAVLNTISRHFYHISSPFITFSSRILLPP